MFNYFLNIQIINNEIYSGNYGATIWSYPLWYVYLLRLGVAGSYNKISLFIFREQTSPAFKLENETVNKDRLIYVIHLFLLTDSMNWVHFLYLPLLLS